MAAAWLVLTEAGGVFTGLGSEPPNDQMVVAAAPTLHTALHEVVLRAAGRAGTETTGG
jgi:myo-inositol-1(or 4)-monophosphatase